MPNQNFFKDCRPEVSGSRVSDLSMYRGDTFSFQLFLESNGKPLNITGGYFWFTVKSDMNDPDSDAVIQKVTGDGIQTVDAANGNVIILLQPIDTEDLNLEESESFYWDLQYQDSLGIIQTLFIGKLKIVAEVTRTQGFNVSGSAVILTAQIESNPFAAGVNPIREGDGFNSEIQQVNVNGALAGTFTLTVEDPNNVGVFETTGALLWNATDTDIRTAIEALTFIDSVAVSGGPTLDVAPVQVAFSGPLIFNLNFSQMVMDISALL